MESEIMEDAKREVIDLAWTVSKHTLSDEQRSISLVESEEALSITLRPGLLFLLHQTTRIGVPSCSDRSNGTRRKGAGHGQ